ncbi:MAG TPA: hypothetical protein ENH29_08265 [Bacteroidetes bacterium]|nr:hypothetical protein [Bacteroidota bacterium]
MYVVPGNQTEVSELSDKVKVQAYNFQVNKSEAEKYKTNKIPATVVKKEKDYGIQGRIRFVRTKQTVDSEN